VRILGLAFHCYAKVPKGYVRDDGNTLGLPMWYIIEIEIVPHPAFGSEDRIYDFIAVGRPLTEALLEDQKMLDLAAVLSKKMGLIFRRDCRAASSSQISDTELLSWCQQEPA
jgi:hypothetical protein